MGKILIVYYYETKDDLKTERYYYEEDFQYRYQNILLDEHAWDFKGSAPKLLNLILELTYECSGDILQEEHWKLASTLQYLWMIYFSLKDSLNYIHINYG